VYEDFLPTTVQDFMFRHRFKAQASDGQIKAIIMGVSGCS
jgi:hypothetical protein